MAEPLNRRLVEIRGADNIHEMLTSLSTQAQRRVVSGALRKAGARLRTYMRRRVPRISGELRKSIDMYSKRSNRTGRVYVGLVRNHYYSTLDYGRKAYKKKYKKGSGQYDVRGTDKLKSEGTHIIETYNDHKQEIAQMVVNQIKLNIAAEWGKLAAKANRGE